MTAERSLQSQVEEMNSKTGARVAVTLDALSLCFVGGSARALIARRRGGQKQVRIMHEPSRTAALRFVIYCSYLSCVSFGACGERG